MDGGADAFNMFRRICEPKLSGKVTLEYLKQLKDLRKRYNKANKYEVEIWSTERMMAE